MIDLKFPRSFNLVGDIGSCLPFTCLLGVLLVLFKSLRLLIQKFGPNIILNNCEKDGANLDMQHC
jgi:hypothetical protein